MKTDFKSLLDKFGVRYVGVGEHHHARPGWVQFDCPRCSPGSGKYRAGFNLSQGYAHCWKCGKLNLSSLLVSLGRLEDGEARRLAKSLRGGSGGSISLRSDRIYGTFSPPPFLGPLLPQHLRYLRGRGFDPDELRELWKLQGLAHLGNLPWRIYIPIPDREGRDASWTTRSIREDAEARYLSASAKEERIPHKELLYGEHLVPGDSVVAVEGPADVWGVGPGAVGCCGIAYTEVQVARLARYRVRGICFDRGESRKAEKLAELLEPFPGETVIINLTKSKDPGCATREEIRRIRKEVGLPT